MPFFLTTVVTGHFMFGIFVFGVYSMMFLHPSNGWHCSSQMSSEMLFFQIFWKKLMTAKLDYFLFMLMATGTV